jgi:hypothetical protein
MSQCGCCVDGCCVPGNRTLFATISPCSNSGQLSPSPIPLLPTAPDDITNNFWSGPFTCGAPGVSQCQQNFELECISLKGDPDHPLFVAQFYNDSGPSSCRAGDCEMLLGPQTGACNPIEVSFTVPVTSGCTRCGCGGPVTFVITITE